MENKIKVKPINLHRNIWSQVVAGKGPPAIQIKKLEKKLKKIEKEFETAPPLRQVRLLRMGESITNKLDILKKMVKL